MPGETKGGVPTDTQRFKADTGAEAPVEAQEELPPIGSSEREQMVEKNKKAFEAARDAADEAFKIYMISLDEGNDHLGAMVRFVEENKDDKDKKSKLEALWSEYAEKVAKSDQFQMKHQELSREMETAARRYAELI